uniref:NAB co-repressor domain-containing protein n=1 Tax=Amphimedon queenslandica TaxID=400682 RepID=A0A1X7UII4_AMPQE
MESIGDALQKANLSQYITPLLDIGADDSEQLASLPEPDFQSLLEMTGMSKKPFHVLRFKKAINRLGPSVGGGGPSGLMGSEAVGDSSTHTVTVYATQIDEPGSIAGSLQRPSPVVPQPMQLQSSGASQHLSSYSLTQNSNSLFELMATRSGVPNSSRLSLISRDQLQALVDDTVPVQQELGPSPISPMIWDKGRLEIFRKASIIFSSSISPLTDQEQLLNEAALQLCLWDPTLLVRQKDLIQLAKKLVKQYPSIVLETGHPIYSAIEPKTDLSWSLFPTSSIRLPLSVNRGPDGKFRNCFEENYERRELQIQQVELLIGENASKEKMKQALLLQAKEKMDYSLALKIQEELSVLGYNVAQLDIKK